MPRLELAQRVGPRADLPRRLARGVERGAAHRLLPAEVQLLLSQPIPVGPQTDALLLEANDHLGCTFGIVRIRPQPLAEESLLVFELSPTPLELLVPPAQGFGRVVQARFLGGRLDDRVLGLLDRLLERRSFGRHDLSSRLGVAVLRLGSVLLRCGLLEGLGNAP